MKSWQSILLGSFLGILASVAIYLIAIPPRGEGIMLSPPPAPVPIQVYVTGEIVHPGVYSLPQNSRVEDAITAAGGLTQNANSAAINLAARLKDEDHIIIPDKNAINPSPAQNSETTVGQISGLININTATSEELQKLPGIGTTRAQAIIDFRVKNGLYKNIDELLSIPGFYPSIFEKIKDMVTVE
jgi:competence protein ComEA